MLGIVEATFGGQEGYLQRIVADELVNVVTSGADVEREAQRQHRKQWKEFNDNRWKHMYRR